MKTWSSTEKLLWILGLLLTVSVGFFNHGIIALDDYSEGFARFVPAQNHTFQETIEGAGIRLPFQSLFLLALGKAGLGLGFHEPIEQLRFVLMLIGAFIFCFHTLTARQYFSTARDRIIVLILTSFYFILPLIYSRPLIENLSGGFLSLGAYAAFKFDTENKKRWVFFSVMAISLAALFRFQTGICIAALPILFLIKRDRSAWGVFVFSCLAGFLATGILDSVLTGGFHRSLISYVDYNIHHASSYGTTPFYSFLLLFLALSLPPSFIGGYRDFPWKKEYRNLLPVFLFFLVFVASHSAIPHKEERFVIPVVVLFLILLTPLAAYWVFDRKSKWRVIYFCLLNFSLLPLASFSTPQSNVISLVRFINDHPEIKDIYDYEGSVVLVPYAFSLRPFKVVPFNGELSFFSTRHDCETPVAIRKDKLDVNPGLRAQLKMIAEFPPGPLENILIRLNPRQNYRRGTIFLFSPKDCL